MTFRRLMTMLAVAALWAVQAVPAIGQDHNTDSEDAIQLTAVESVGQFTTSVPGLYPVGVVADISGGGRGLDLDPATGFLWTDVRDANFVTAYDHAGTPRLTFGVTGNGSGQLSQPQGLAIDKGEVFVAEEGNDRVQVFDTQGNHLRMWGTLGAGAGQFNEPCDVEVVGGFVYVLDASNHRIQVFTKVGNFVRQFGGAGAGDGQLGLTCSSSGLTHHDGEIFVTDYSNGRIAVFDLDGNWERNFGSGTLQNPVAVDADGSGQIWVTDVVAHKVTVWSTVGAPRGDFGGLGSAIGTFSQPLGIVVDPSGDSVWVVDVGNARIQAFTTLKCEGNLLTHVGTSYNDKIVTGSDNDVINLGAGKDTAATKGGDDIVCAGPGSDTVNGGSGDDRIFGVKGNDKLKGASGDDYIIGGRGDDNIYGGKGSDFLDGYLGNDRLWGGPKGDVLKGNLGDDILRGESGNDILKGGKNTDKCFGGTGSNDQAKSCETTSGIP